MKAIKAIILSAAALMTLCACDLARISPSNAGKYEIVDQIDFPRCMKPVGLTSTVEMCYATLEWKIFPDAQKYIIEFYNREIPELAEPDASALLKTITIDSKEVPYVFTGEEDVTYYYRVRSTHEGKEPSKWSASDKFTTESDPSIVCTRPREITIAQVGSAKVKCTWDTYPDTEYYILEVYSKSIPESGEPSATDRVLNQQIAVTDIPATITFSQPYGTYYYRIKACNPASGRRDSKWAKGSFKTIAFTWPSDPNALTEGFTTSEVKKCPEMNAVGSGNKLPKDIVFEKITYAVECSYYGDRVSFSGSNKTESRYGGTLPINRHIRFTINVPGSITFVPRCSSSGKYLTVSVVTIKEGEEKVTTVYNEIFDKNVSPSSGGVPLTFTFSEDLLYGIKQPAIVYIWSSNGGAQQVYPMTWAPAAL